MNKPQKTERSTILSIALLALAGAIVYLAYALIKVATIVPPALTRVDQVNQQIPAILEVAQEYRTVVPDILDEMSAVRQQIPDILARVDRLQMQVDALQQDIPLLIDNNVPAILARVDKMQLQIEQVQAELPKILSTMDSTTQVIAETNQQIANITPLIPQILQEVATVRGEIPGYFDRAEGLVADTRDVTEEAGKGMFTGLLKGIVSAPFELLRAPANMFGDDLKNKRFFTNEDFELSLNSAKYVLSQRELTSNSWRNPETKNEGKVTAIEDYQFKGRHCRKISLMFVTANGKKEELQRDACINENGQWEQVD